MRARGTPFGYTINNARNEINTIHATFCGDDGSMGFMTGYTYVITIILRRSNLFMVEVVEGTLFCPYSSIEAFLSNWAVNLELVDLLYEFQEKWTGRKRDGI